MGGYLRDVYWVVAKILSEQKPFFSLVAFVGAFLGPLLGDFTIPSSGNRNAFLSICDDTATHHEIPQVDIPGTDKAVGFKGKGGKVEGKKLLKVT